MALMRCMLNEWTPGTQGLRFSRLVFVGIILACATTVGSCYGDEAEKSGEKRDVAKILNVYKQQFVPLDTQVLIIGIDGATWDIIDPMIEQGRLPYLSRLIENGSRANMLSVTPTLSPALWTTVATGKTPDKHGIRGHLALDPTGDSRPVMSSSYHRLVPALWNIASFFGLKVGFAGWWATYPAEEVNGFIVSDRATIRRQNVDKLYTRTHNIKIDTKPHREEDIYPPEFFGAIRALFRQPKDLRADEFHLFAELSEEEMEEIRTEPLDTHVPMSIIMRTYLEDSATFGICLDQIREQRLNLVGLWLGGVDASEHLFWQYFRPQDYDVHVPDPKLVKKYAEVIPKNYEYIDGWLGHALEAVDGTWTIVVLSDHGHHAKTDFGKTGNTKEYYLPWSGEHLDAPDGIFILSGRHAKKGGDRRLTIELADVAPTVLHLLGVPVGEDMDGRVAREFIDDSFMTAHPIRKFPTLDILPWKPRQTSPLPEVAAETLEKLKALGYIGGDNQPQKTP